LSSVPDDDPDEEPKSHTARAGTARGSGAGFSAMVMVRAHLWLHWAKIAVRQERRAWIARERGQKEADFAAYIGLETEEAIEGIAAARHCIHNFFRVLRELGLPNEKKLVLQDFSTATSVDPDKWLSRVKELIGDRNDAVHHDEVTTPTQPHPGYATNVGGVSVSFTAERATQAVDVMLNDVLRLALTAPLPALTHFAEDYAHVLAQLDRQRDHGVDPW
jgi:hypothetical protein